ncbi:dnaJ-like protein MG200 homolog [Corythoichthys intestinalis]|uniref:dnaJ-like protein MG200 homolog n=1 Tax=Corythoichthys intestinalis TaxID=161448 RepID=UPI0025A68AC9|nr:dnaJ-like protein MG200 homolog [Corythoichthys intestinalis]
MGCSSSSAQTVDQEKRPGTKPEESNGSALAGQNGIIAETTEHNTTVSAIMNDLHQGSDDGEETLLVVMETQEDLASGEDPLTDLEPQQDPVTFEESGSDDGPAQASHDLALDDVPVKAVEPVMAIPLVEDDNTTTGDVKMVQAEVSAREEETCKKELPVQDDAINLPAIEESKTERPTVEVEQVQTDVPSAVEQASTVLAEASPEVAEPVAEVGVTDAKVADIPDEMVASLETPTENSLQISTSVIDESPASTEAPSKEVETLADALVEDSTTAKSFEVNEAVIDTGIAVATIPEMPPSVVATNETQNEQQPADEESNGSFVMPSETAQQAEPICPAESTSSQASALVAKEQQLEVPSSSILVLESSSKEVSEVLSDFGASPSSVASDVELPAAEPTQTEIEVNSSAPDQAFDPSTEGPAAAECHQDVEQDRAKKDD